VEEVLEEKLITIKMPKNNIVIDRPLDFLNQSKEKNVLVFLKGDKVISGTLIAFDIHINLIIKNSKLLKEKDSFEKNLGLIFIRGDEISFVSPSLGEK